MFNDEYLDYWGAVFVTARLLEQGIPFYQFLENPWGCLKAVGFSSVPRSLACDYRPLLPRQVRVAQALWRRWEPETAAGGPVIPQPVERLALMEEEGIEP